MPQTKWQRYYQKVQESPVFYTIQIQGKNVIKLGSTNKPKYRLKNLRTAIYEPHSVKTYSCDDLAEARSLEKYAKTELTPLLIRGEWYACGAEDVDVIAREYFNDI